LAVEFFTLAEIFGLEKGIFKLRFFFSALGGEAGLPPPIRAMMAAAAAFLASFFAALSALGIGSGDRRRLLLPLCLGASTPFTAWNRCLIALASSAWTSIVEYFRIDGFFD